MFNPRSTMSCRKTILLCRSSGKHFGLRRHRHSVEAGPLPILVASSCFLASDPPLRSILATIGRSESPSLGKIFGGQDWTKTAARVLGLENAPVPIELFPELPSDLVYAREGSSMTSYRFAIQGPFEPATWLASRSEDAILTRSMKRVDL